MANAAHGKKVLAIAVVACLCAALISTPAFAFYYVHSESNTAASNGKGAIEVCLTVDETAIGGNVRTELTFVPEGSTAQACIDEGVVASNNYNDVDALHDYEYSSLADYLADKNWTCTVYKAGSQKPGTHTTYDSQATTGENTPVERFDSVVITVE